MCLKVIFSLSLDALYFVVYWHFVNVCDHGWKTHKVSLCGSITDGVFSKLLRRSSGMAFQFIDVIMMSITYHEI